MSGNFVINASGNSGYIQCLWETEIIEVIYILTLYLRVFIMSTALYLVFIYIFLSRVFVYVVKLKSFATSELFKVSKQTNMLKSGNLSLWGSGRQPVLNVD